MTKVNPNNGNEIKSQKCFPGIYSNLKNNRVFQ